MTLAWLSTESVDLLLRCTIICLLLLDVAAMGSILLFRGSIMSVILVAVDQFRWMAVKRLLLNTFWFLMQDYALGRDWSL